MTEHLRLGLPIRLTEPSAVFGNYNHALLGHEGYFKCDFVGSSRSVSHVVSMEDIAQR